MELIYIYIEKYRTIEKQEFLINSDFDVNIIHQDSLNGKPLVGIEINKNAQISKLSIYGENIINITAIVGKNSSGKSSFLNCIGNLWESRENGEFIIVYENDNKEIIIETINMNLYCINQKKIIKNEKQGFSQLFKYENIKIAEYQLDESNSYQLSKLDKNLRALSNLEYISIAEEFNDIRAYNVNGSHPINRFGQPYNKNSVLYPFIYLTGKKEENYNNNILELCFKIGKQNNTYRKNFILPEWEICKKNKDKYKEIFLLALLDARFDVIEHSLYGSSECSISEESLVHYNSIKQKIDNLKGNLNELIRQKIFFNTELKCFENLEKDKNTIKIPRYLEFLEKLYILINKSNDFEFKLITSESELEAKINLTNIVSNNLIDEFRSLLSIEYTQDWASVHLLTKMITPQIKYLSDGLKYLLYVFGSVDYSLSINKNLLKEKFKKQNEVNQTIILLLDEPDVHFHPEWSRIFINNLIEFISENYTKCKFQIIMTTHSPFILSDIIKCNVIKFTKKDGKTVVNKNIEDTFGANIHTLLKSSFFMESTMGEFARNQINQAINFINNKETSLDKNQALTIINLIGEPIIKNKLLKMYYNKFPDEYIEPALIYKEKLERLESIIENDAKLSKKDLLALEDNLNRTLEFIKQLNLGREKND